MNSMDLPPLPKPGAYGPQVCAIVRLYLAVLDDLQPEQIEALSEHVRNCPSCAQELDLLSRSTQMIASLKESVPSTRVNQAILAAAAEPARAISNTYRGRQARPSSTKPLVRRASPRLIGPVVAAAVLMLILFTTLHFFGASSGNSEAFQLPDNLSWTGYVLHYSQTKVGTNGLPYHIDCYQDLGTGNMHVETTMADLLDVVTVGARSTVLGLDMIHHVAQWGANGWSVDDSTFDLSSLRSALQEHQATYMGKVRFDGQDVYRIRDRSGHVLLLDMRYRPVNVLQAMPGSNGAGANELMYDSFKLMSSSEVSNSMWNMSVPANFQMGTLPPRP